LWNINSAIVVVTDERSEVTGRDIRTLAPRGWLTDEIVNNYFGLIMQRYDDCFAFNTFFYTKLREGSSQDVMKHDKKVDIFAKRIIFIPVYLRAHWCLIIVNNENRTIEYFDSLHSRREVFDVIIKDYLTIKWRRKKKGKLPLYTSMHTQGPLQTNGWDCGIFACQTAEFTARRSDLYFEQKHMNYLRHKMTLEIADKTLMTTQ
jgi:Ulp1 family protease